MKLYFVTMLLGMGLLLPVHAQTEAVTPAQQEESSLLGGLFKKKKKKTAAPAAQQQPQEVKGPTHPDIQEVVCNKESMLQITKDKDNWFFTLPDSLLGRLMLAVTRYVQTPAGMQTYGGEEVREQTVYFELTPNGRNLLLKSDILYNHADTLDAIAKSVNNSSANPILHIFKLEPGAPKGHYKINVNALLLSDNSFSLDRYSKLETGAGMMLGPNSYIESVHSYPINTEVRTVRTYVASSQSLPGSYTTGNVTVKLNTSFVLLPKEPMRARLFDPRVGYFTNGYNEFSDHEQKVNFKRFITRWRLEPKDEDIEKMKRGELVEPKKQIVYYIDPATPKQWVPYLIAGVNDWNKAFEQAGFKNAIVGKEWPDSAKDMSTEDARFSVIRYLASDIANAYGPNVHDPRSGEIIESHIGWYHNVMTLVHDWYMIQAANVDPKARTAKFDEELMGQLIRFVSSHEVGHTLGLRHNFGSSSTVPVEKLRDKAWVSAHGHTPSIMDYARFNYVAQPEDGMTEHELFPRINDYDKWAIQWGYMPILDATDSESDRYLLSKITVDSLRANRRLWWGDGEGYRLDPRRQTEDLSDDAVRASEYGIKNLKAEVLHLQEWNYWGNDINEENLNNVYYALVGQLYRYCGHVAKYVSGTYAETPGPDEAGARYAETPREKAKSVLPFFDREVFHAPTWLVEVPYMNRLTKDPESILRGVGQYVLNLLTNYDNLKKLNPNYPIEEFLPELTEMIFTELKTTEPVSSYRRSLQRKLVNNLAINFATNKTSDPSDHVAILLMTLKDLQKRCKAAADKQKDTITKAHYLGLVDLIERATAVETGSAASGYSTSLHDMLTEQDECLPIPDVTIPCSCGEKH